MKVAKVISLIIGGFLLFMYVVACIIYWGSQYGALGIFGTIITFPFSIIFSFGYFLFMGWQAVINNVVWVGLGILLCCLGVSNE